MRFADSFSARVGVIPGQLISKNISQAPSRGDRQSDSAHLTWLQGSGAVINRWGLLINEGNS